MAGFGRIAWFDGGHFESGIGIVGDLG